MFKIALIMNHNSYPGREYIDALIKAGIKFEIISIGNYPKINLKEDERCNNLWKLKDFNDLVKNVIHYNFSSLKDENLIKFLEIKNYDLGIQGGTGILRENVFTKFKLGILNFHPGDLPGYQGCSAPEWQIFEDKPIISTCHLIDSGIDSGNIYKKKKLNIDYTNYYTMRASIYPETAKFVVEIIQDIINHNGFVVTPIRQSQEKMIYREYIGEEKINYIKEKLSKKLKLSLKESDFC